ncbi:MAG TPA: hypothetical protein VMF14_06650 [Solirubrobacteraceae bacterium]|nr:hypothetical protein [Solirubrobacteraceae bacterium]
MQAPAGPQTSDGRAPSRVRALATRAAARPVDEPIPVSAAAVATLEGHGREDPLIGANELSVMARQLRAAATTARATRYRRRREAWVGDTLADWCSFGVLVGLALFVRAWWHQSWSFAVWAWVVMVVYASVVGLFSGFVRWHPVARDLLAPATRRLDRRWSDSWSDTARTYFAVGASLIVVLAVTVTILSIAFPGTVAGLALAAPLGGLADGLALLFVVLLRVAEQALRLPDDPYPELITGLLEALTALGQARAGAQAGEVLDAASRRAVARTLDRPARVIAADAALYPPISGDIGAPARAAALTLGGRVAAWLHQCQTDALWPSPSAAAELETRLRTALIGACTGDWGQLELAAPDPTPVSAWRRLAPRAALTVALVGAAFLLPIAFAHSLSSTAQDTMRVSLIIAAVTALVTPAQALSDVSSAVSAIPGAAK